MKSLADIISKYGAEEANLLESGNNIIVEVNSTKYELTKEDIIIERKEREGLTVLNEGSLTVALDTKLTEELIQEGIAREFIRHIQNLRKDKDLAVTDRIKIFYKSPENIKKAITNLQNLIKEETLAIDILEKENLSKEVNVDDVDIFIELEKV